MADLRFPVGTFVFDKATSPDKRAAWIRQIAETPALMRSAIDGLNARQIETPYRPGGWTVRQVVHHVPDSHLNAYCRYKLALTEDNPTIKPYDEAAWANIADTARTPPEVSLALLDALHARWVVLLESMTSADFERPLQHPERGAISLDWMLQLYAWHGRHHAAHVTELRKREGW
jgi:DinB superfamily